LATRRQDTFERAFAIQIADFKDAHPDVKIEVVARPLHDHYTAMVQQAEAASSDFDLFLCNTDWLTEAISKGLLTPLNSHIQANPPVDWPYGWHPAMLGLQTQNGVVYGLPWHDGPEIFHYRKDLFQNAEEQAAYAKTHREPLKVPRTWSEFLKVAKFFTRPEDDFWGCCEGAYTDGHNNVYDFLIQLWSRGGVLFDASGCPQFHRQPGIEGLQFYVDLFQKHRVASPECLNLGSVEVGDYYARGRAAMMWNWSGFAAVCEIPEFSNIVGKNACTTIPAGDGPNGRSVSLNIYWTLTLTAGSRNKDLAYRFMQHITQPHLDKVVSMCGANGVRLSTWQDPEVLAQYPYYGIIEEVHAGSITMPTLPEYPSVNHILSEAIHNAVHEGRSVEEELQNAAALATKLLKDAGRISS
jgi:multiple sugar transport system substrate-binding protein